MEVIVKIVLIEPSSTPHIAPKNRYRLSCSFKNSRTSSVHDTPELVGIRVSGTSLRLSSQLLTLLTPIVLHQPIGIVALYDGLYWSVLTDKGARSLSHTTFRQTRPFVPRVVVENNGTRHMRRAGCLHNLLLYEGGRCPF